MQKFAAQFEFLNRATPRSGWARRFAAAAIFFLTALTVSAANFTATLDRDTVAAGESATLTLTFDGGSPKNIPQPPAIPNLQIAYQGTSQNFVINNGQSSATISATFAVTPMQPGDYTIPALRAEVDGKILTSQPLRLKAVKPGASVASNTGDQLLFLKLFVPKKEVYVGEVIGVQLQLYVRDGVANAEGILQGFENLTSSAVTAEGFSTIKTVAAQRRRGQIGNAIYTVATLVTALTPVKTGTLTINSISTTVTVQLPSGQRRRDVWDPFGMFQQYEERRVAISAEPETLTALALPRENAPANFNGAVGSYTMTVTAGPTNVAAGDPITVKIQIAGKGALDSLALPSQTAWDNFKTYPPTSKVETTDALGIQGTKTFEQVVVPQNAGIKELPPISFSYFDSDKKKFETLSSGPIGLIVRPGGAVSVPAVAATKTSAQEAPPAQDIVSIKLRPGKLEPPGAPLIQKPWFVAVQTAPVLAFIGAVFVRRRNEALANNPRLRRQRKVAQLVRDGMSDLQKFAAEKDSEQFFATLFHLLQEQLGACLDLPASAITEAVVDEQLKSLGVAEPTLATLHELFAANNLARYAPIKSSQELEAMIPKLENVLRELQEVKA
jgi:hypothetical protein